MDLADIKGQEHAKRALEVAAAGNHNFLTSRSPRHREDAAGPRAPGDSPLPLAGGGSGGDAGLRVPADPPTAVPGPHYTISHARLVGGGRFPAQLEFPAAFMLAAAMNPCPCGYYGDPLKPCTCSPTMVPRYQKRLSGPLLDRIDIRIEAPRLEFEKLSDGRRGEPSA